MSLLEAAVVRIVSLLEDSRVPYVVIGGFANLYWGRPRLTQDIDVVVQVPDARLEAFVENVRAHAHPVITDPIGFVRETRVLPLQLENGVRVDLIHAGIPFEEQAIARGVTVAIGESSVRLCAPEDLIVFKLVSERPRDREDVEGVIARQGAKLDLEYLGTRVRELVTDLGRPEILTFYSECLRKNGLTPA